jgi:hypothetical protein
VIPTKGESRKEVEEMKLVEIPTVIPATSIQKPV